MAAAAAAEAAAATQQHKNSDGHRTLMGIMYERREADFDVFGFKSVLQQFFWRGVLKVSSAPNKNFIFSKTQFLKPF